LHEDSIALLIFDIHNVLFSQAVVLRELLLTVNDGRAAVDYREGPGIYAHREICRSLDRFCWTSIGRK